MFRTLMIGAVSTLTHGSDEQMFGPNENYRGPAVSAPRLTDVFTQRAKAPGRGVDLLLFAARLRREALSTSGMESALKTRSVGGELSGLILDWFRTRAQIAARS